MRSLLRFLISYHHTILFIILEVVAFILIAQFSSFHQAKLSNLHHGLLGGLNRKVDNFTGYLTLEEENKALVEENARLYNLLPASYFSPVTNFRPDTNASSQYQFISGRVINNTVNKQYNFITINIGRLNGVEPEMAVICNEGIVGIVKEVTNNYASVVSVLNREFFPSAKIRRTGHYGPIEWPGKRYNEVVLKEIPLHAQVTIGDTIVTTGYTEVFPENIMVGTVKDYEVEEGIYYNITVLLSTDFKKVSNILVVKNFKREEVLELEETSHD